MRGCSVDENSVLYIEGHEILESIEGLALFPWVLLAIEISQEDRSSAAGGVKFTPAFGTLEAASELAKRDERGN